MIKLWQTLRQSSTADQGIFALMTLLFFMACGIGALFILWGIAQATGVYNTAYFATQSAARAAASTAEPGTEEGDGWLICVKDSPPRDPALGWEAYTTCPGVDNPNNPQAAIRAAKQSLNIALDPNLPGTFNVVSLYSGTDLAGKFPLFIRSLKVYNINPDTGAAGQKACAQQVGQDYGLVEQPEDGDNPDGVNGKIGCWSVVEPDRTSPNGLQTFPWQYQSGVVLRTRVEIGFPLGCRADSGGYSDGSGNRFCINIPVDSVGAARVALKDPVPFYELYNCYGVERDADASGGEDRLTEFCEHDSSYDEF